MTEKWRWVGPDYEVSDLGRVRSYLLRGSKKRARAAQPQVLKPRISKNGYPAVQVYGRSRYAHVLVLEAFVGPRPEGMESCHDNNDRRDCRLVNLRWDTVVNNNADKVRHGTAQRGERHGQAKLTADLVRLIRASTESTTTLGRRYGVHRMTIHQARIGRTWKWLT